MSEIEKIVKYWPNGPKKWEKTYKDGKEISCTKWHYYPNRQKEYEETYKDGELDGLRTRWFESGQKWKEGTYKYGKPDGLWTEWYINGQKMLEATCKDGEVISIQNWSKDGNLIGINEAGSLNQHWALMRF